MSDREWLQRWVEAVNADAENAHIGRWSSFVVRAQDDAGAEETVRYHRGAVAIGPVEDAGAAVITLRGPRSAWRELADPQAAPRRHDLLALTKVADGIEIVAGRDHLIRHLRVLNRLVELGRARG
jgi:hypothetical protein